MAHYRRILLKLSGEALAGGKGFGIVPEAIQPICREIQRLHETGIEIAIVVGGGNIFRGLKASEKGIDRVTADYMGMLATIINCLAIQDVLEKLGISTRIMSALPIVELSQAFSCRKAVYYLETGKVVLFAGGTGNPYFSTDTAASLRAVQIGAEVILKGTKVDGIYEGDPVVDPSVKKFETITFGDVLKLGLKVMDSTAIAMCRDNNIPIIVFNLSDEGALLKIINGEPVGSIIKEDENV